MALPIISSRPEFPGVPKPATGAYKIPVTATNQILQMLITPAIYAVFTPTDQWQVSVQRGGGTVQIIFLESITQATMDKAFKSTPSYYSLDMRMFKSLVKNTIYILRVSMTDSTGKIKALAPNLNIILT